MVVPLRSRERERERETSGHQIAFSFTTLVPCVVVCVPVEKLWCTMYHMS